MVIILYIWLVIQIRVHTFSVPLIRAYHSDSVIQIKKSSSLYPLLLSAPRILNNTSLNAHIIITGPRALLKNIHPESGHTLYRTHTDMLMQWMYAHLVKGLAPYSAMVEFYSIYNITEDDLPFDTAYKIWQRWLHKKKSKTKLTFSRAIVLPKSAMIGDRREEILRYLAGSFQEFALDALHHHPLPSDSEVKTYLMRSLYSAGWTLSDIGSSFGCSKQVVHRRMARR